MFDEKYGLIFYNIYNRIYIIDVDWPPEYRLMYMMNNYYILYKDDILYESETIEGALICIDDMLNTEGDSFDYMEDDREESRI